jgi:hypothetical protein
MTKKNNNNKKNNKKLNNENFEINKSLYIKKENTKEENKEESKEDSKEEINDKENIDLEEKKNSLLFIKSIKLKWRNISIKKKIIPKGKTQNFY